VKQPMVSPEELSKFTVVPRVLKIAVRALPRWRGPGMFCAHSSKAHFLFTDISVQFQSADAEHEIGQSIVSALDLRPRASLGAIF